MAHHQQHLRVVWWPPFGEKVLAIWSKWTAHQEHQMAQVWFNLQWWLEPVINDTKEPGEPPGLTVKNGCILCPDCWTSVNVGKFGIQNYYKHHKGSVQCAMNKKKKNIEDTIEKTKQNALWFFCPKSPTMPPTVKVPAPVHPCPPLITLPFSTSPMQFPKRPSSSTFLIWNVTWVVS